MLKKHASQESYYVLYKINSVTIGVVLVFRDITEQSNIQDILQRTEKLESLSILASGIAHDFNNLLGGIFCYIDIAKSVSTNPVDDLHTEAFILLNESILLLGSDLSDFFSISMLFFLP